MTETQQWTERYGHALMNTFGPPKLVLERGAGLPGLGRRRQRVRRLPRRHRRQHARPRPPGAGRCRHPPAGDARPRVELLRHQAPDRAGRAAARAWPRPGVEGRAFFCNSGAEANEAALKLTRLTGRTRVVAMEDAFHGRTMGSLALTSKAAYREPFEPLPGEVTWVPYGDVDALAAAVTDETAAVVIEPLQGEAGVNVASTEFLRAAREITTRSGALPVAGRDPVGDGPHRHLAGESPRRHHAGPGHAGQGLAGGIPIGALLAFGDAAGLFAPATTAPPSAGTRSPRPRRSPSSTPSAPRACSPARSRWADRLRAGSRRTLGSPRCGARVCWSVSR